MRFTTRSVMQALGVATAMAAMATPAMAEQYIVKFKDNASFQSAKAQKALATHAILDAHDKGSLVTIDIANKDVAPEKQSLYWHFNRFLERHLPEGLYP